MPIEMAVILSPFLLAESDSAAPTLEIMRPVQLLYDGLLPLLETGMVGGQHNGADGD